MITRSASAFAVTSRQWNTSTSRVTNFRLQITYFVEGKISSGTHTSLAGYKSPRLESQVLIYTAPLIISVTGPTIWSKTKFAPTGHHHLPSSRLPRVCFAPRASTIFKCILKVVFCECSAQPAILPPSSQLYQFYLHSRKQRNVGHSGQTCLGGKRNDATASSFVIKIRGEVFAHFHCRKTSQ
jgi:hypothetical protein